MNDMRIELSALFKLALPLILAQLAQNSLTFIDTLMVGRLGNEALAGIALGGTFFHLTTIMLSGILFAVGPMVSQAYGAKDKESIARSVRHGLVLAIVVALPAFLLFSRSEAILLAMGQNPDTAKLSARYLQAIAWGFLPVLWLTAIRGLFEGQSNTRPIMLLSFMAVGLNVLANNALMFGRWGFPALGLVGTGYASAFVYSIMFLCLLAYALWLYRDYGLFKSFRPDWGISKELLRIGLPIGLILGFEVGMFAAVSFLMGLISQDALAGHQIAIQTASITFMVPLGLSIATSVRVGQAAGRKDMLAARRAGLTGIMVCAGFMVLTATGFLLFPKQIVGFYLDTADPRNTAVMLLAISFLKIAGMFQIFDGLQVSASGALRGLKDTRIPMLITLIAYWIIGIGSSLLLAFVFNLGGRGLWLGLIAGLAVAGLLLSYRFNTMTKNQTQGYPSNPELEI